MIKELGIAYYLFIYNSHEPFFAGLGTLYGPFIPYILPASVHC